jgi:hypothetical protein
VQNIASMTRELNDWHPLATARGSVPKPSHFISDDFVGRVTPVAIPNAKVKPLGADGTARVTALRFRKGKWNR